MTARCVHSVLFFFEIDLIYVHKFISRIYVIFSQANNSNGLSSHDAPSFVYIRWKQKQFLSSVIAFTRHTAVHEEMRQRTVAVYVNIIYGSTN